MTGDRRYFDETPVVLLMQRPEDAALHWFEAVSQIGDRPVADDVGGILQEAMVHAPMEGQFHFHRLAIATAAGRVVRFLFVLGSAHLPTRFSMIPAPPMPPPTHMVTRP